MEGIVAVLQKIIIGFKRIIVDDAGIYR